MVSVSSEQEKTLSKERVTELAAFKLTTRFISKKNNHKVSMINTRTPSARNGGIHYQHQIQRGLERQVFDIKFREASRGMFHAILVIVSNDPGQLDINNFTSTVFRFKHGQHSTTLGLKYHPLF
jgi:hypothetical protein